MNRRAKAFTLIEVLVVLSIVSIALVTAVRSSGGFSRQSANLIGKANARMVAKNIIADFKLAGLASNKASKSGVEDMGFSRWYWQAEISPHEAAPFPAPVASTPGIAATKKTDLIAVEVRVFAQEGDEHHAYRLVEYLMAKAQP